VTKIYTSQNGDLNVEAIQSDGSLVVSTSDIDGITETGTAVLTAADVAALQQVVAPGSTILSAAATTAIAALVAASATAEEIVNALQAT